MDLCDEEQELINLRKSNQEMEKYLKSFGIDINELPPDISKTLNEYAEIQYETGIDVSSTTDQVLDIELLSQWHINQKIEQIELKSLELKLKNSQKRVERCVKQEQNEVDELKGFLSNYENNLQLPKQEEKDSLETLIKNMETKLANIKKPPVDLNIDEIIEKVNHMENLK